MSSLRGSTTLLDNAAIAAADANSGATPEAYVGPGVNVAVMIWNRSAGSMTFKLQAAAAKGNTSGRNTDPEFWADYQGQTAITLATGATICVDLTAFAPPYIRVVRTDAGASGNASILVHSVGQN